MTHNPSTKKDKTKKDGTDKKTISKYIETIREDTKLIWCFARCIHMHRAWHTMKPFTIGTHTMTELRYDQLNTAHTHTHTHTTTHMNTRTKHTVTDKCTFVFAVCLLSMSSISHKSLESFHKNVWVASFPLTSIPAQQQRTNAAPSWAFESSSPPSPEGQRCNSTPTYAQMRRQLCARRLHWQIF